jgi:myosin heavy subunit
VDNKLMWIAKGKKDIVLEDLTKEQAEEIAKITNDTDYKIDHYLFRSNGYQSDDDKISTSYETSVKVDNMLAKLLSENYQKLDEKSNISLIINQLLSDQRDIYQELKHVIVRLILLYRFYTRYATTHWYKAITSWSIEYCATYAIYMSFGISTEYDASRIISVQEHLRKKLCTLIGSIDKSKLSDYNDIFERYNELANLGDLAYSFKIASQIIQVFTTNIPFEFTLKFQKDIDSLYAHLRKSSELLEVIRLTQHCIDKMLLLIAPYLINYLCVKLDYNPFQRADELQQQYDEASMELSAAKTTIGNLTREKSEQSDAFLKKTHQLEETIETSRRDFKQQLTSAQIANSELRQHHNKVLHEQQEKANQQLSDMSQQHVQAFANQQQLSVAAIEQAKRNNSELKKQHIAALRQQEGAFTTEIEDAKRDKQMLSKQLSAINQRHEEALRTQQESNLAIKEANQSNQILSKQLLAITQQHEEALRTQKEQLHQIEKLNQQLSASKTHHDNALRENQAQSKAAIDKERQANQELAARIQHLIQANTDSQRNFIDAKQALEEANNKLQRQIKAKYSEIISLQGTNSNLKEQNKKELNRLRKRYIGNIRSFVQKHEEHHQEVQQLNEELEAKIQQLQTEADGIRGEYTSYQSEVQDAFARHKEEQRRVRESLTTFGDTMNSEYDEMTEKVLTHRRTKSTTPGPILTRAREFRQKRDEQNKQNTEVCVSLQRTNEDLKQQLFIMASLVARTSLENETLKGQVTGLLAQVQEEKRICASGVFKYTVMIVGMRQQLTRLLHEQQQHEREQFMNVAMAVNDSVRIPQLFQNAINVLQDPKANDKQITAVLEAILRDIKVNSLAYKNKVYSLTLLTTHAALLGASLLGYFLS